MSGGERFSDRFFAAESSESESESKSAERERGRARVRASAMPTSVVVSDGEAEDDHLLSLVAAAEASALASKRQRISPFSTSARSSSAGGFGGGAGGGVGTAAEEGSYTAALRGSRSALWQQQQKQLQQGKGEDFKSVGGGYAAGVSASGARAVGSCFKCGQPGHWARDCAAGGGGYMEPVRDRVVHGGLGTEGDVIAKACPCGLGDCLVLTSNTTRNPGRKFYRCPMKEENGGCNFFGWCEAVPASSNFPSNSSSVPELSCPCGAGSCLVLTAKMGKNVGQQFYRCPLDQGAGSCGFFKWCNQYKSSADPLGAESRCWATPNNTNPQFAGGRSASRCFRCGQDGHWAKDCPKHESDSHASTRGNSSASSGSCFKCGQVGHWARECPAQNNISSSGRKMV